MFLDNLCLINIHILRPLMHTFRKKWSPDGGITPLIFETFSRFAKDTRYSCIQSKINGIVKVKIRFDFRTFCLHFQSLSIDVICAHA